MIFQFFENLFFENLFFENLFFENLHFENLHFETLVKEITLYYFMADISRKERAFIQNIYLLNMNPVKNQYIREFRVVGTTGNVYTVSINNNPNCTCPDFQYRGKICKHIYFIMLRIMKINGEVQRYYDKEELLYMFDNIPSHVEGNLVRVKKNIKQSFNDHCPICFDVIKKNTNGIDYCKQGCGKSVHIECLDIWMKSNGKKLKCFFCGHDWSDIIEKVDEDWEEDWDSD